MNLLHKMYNMEDKLPSRSNDHKKCHQPNQRFISNFKLGDLQIWVKVIADATNARVLMDCIHGVNHENVGQICDESYFRKVNFGP